MMLISPNLKQILRLKTDTKMLFSSKTETNLFIKNRKKIFTRSNKFSSYLFFGKGRLFLALPERRTARWPFAGAPRQAEVGRMRVRIGWAERTSSRGWIHPPHLPAWARTAHSFKAVGSARE
jgi:hypothetical protein